MVAGLFNNDRYNPPVRCGRAPRPVAGRYAMNDTQSGLRFSFRTNWAPLYINGKLIAGRIMPLHRIDERLFGAMDDRGSRTLQEFYYSHYGIHCHSDDRRLSAVDFLRKNHLVSHAILATYDKTVLLLGYNIFHYRFTETNPPAGIYIDYFTSVPVNYPGNIKLPYLGRFLKDNTFYRVRGVGRLTIAHACWCAIEMHPGEKRDSVAVDLVARPDDALVQKYVKDYGFTLHKGKRGKQNNLYITYQTAKKFLRMYERAYQKLERPEGNGISFKDPLKY